MTTPASLLPRRGLPWVQNAIFFSLTAMEMAWFAPLALFLLPETWRTPPIIYLAGLWLAMLGMMVIAHFLEQRNIPSPAFEIIVAGVLILLGLLAIRIFIFGDEPLFSLSWLSRLFSLPDDDVMRMIAVLGALAFLWWRAVTFLQREISFFIIGYDFRKGVLALLFTVSFYRIASHQSAMIFIYVFFFFGLLAVALGRSEDKARAVSENMANIPRLWLGVVGLSVTAVMALGWLFGQIWSLAGFRALWRLFTPVLGWMTPYAQIVALAFMRLLSPLLEWMLALIASRINSEDSKQVLESMARNLAKTDQFAGQEQAAYTPPAWIVILFRYVTPIAILLAILLALIFWLTKRSQARSATLQDVEHERVAGIEARGLRNALRRGLERFREAAELAGQFGLGRKFYAAISIRHIYANMQKLAARRGHPRDPAWTPNDYLPALQRAFPGQDEALRHITDVYNDYEYGHVSIEPAELERLRAAWESLQQTAPPAPADDEANK